ncbi:MAG: hypothetical protein IKC02_05780 [Oscillospiraceae bacterium]|nr:hypothetical protein [Oscillospiraceae bacterium]
MPFGTALIWGIFSTMMVIILVPYWADIFKIEMSGKVLLIAFPILLVVTTLYNLLAPDKLWEITTIVGIVSLIISLAVHWIRVLIIKWKE